MRKLAATFLSILAGVVVSTADAARENAIIVLDASGSMWGRIDDTPKIVIAREVLAGLLAEWPADRQLGIVAYGHRREGDCQDIEQILPVGPLDVGRTVELINGISPKGRTPLTEAVRQAAEQLSFEDTPATVILLSDGLETCQADPCALGEELARRGVDFTAHVIGFDVAEEDYPQLSCLAESTGGTFLPAGNADELQAALATAAQTVEPVLPDELRFRGINSETGAVFSEVEWSVSVDGQPPQTVLTGGEWLVLDPQAADYRVEGRQGPFEGVLELTLAPGSDGDHDVPMERVAAQVTVKSLDDATGAPLSGVNWRFLNLATEESTSAVVGASSYTTIVAPGSYRIEATQEQKAGSIEITVEPRSDTTHEVRLSGNLPAATLKAPAEIPAGSVFTVEWTGPADSQDYITIVEVGAPAGAYNDYARVKADGKPVEITAPDAVGKYEVRYVLNASKTVLASQPVALTPVEAEVMAPAEIPAGSNFTVEWTGPVNPQDYITIVEVGAPEGKYNDYARVKADGKPVEITAPDALGQYEVRYVVQQSGRTLASQPVSLVAVDATVSAPAEIPAGSTFTVEWTGPVNPQDYITIVEVGAPEGKYNDYARVKADGKPVEITAPDALGQYEVRYVVQQSGRTLASQAVTLTSIDATLIVPPEVPAGSSFTVEWTGPANPQDYITIVEAGAPEGTYNDYARVKADGKPVQITAPDALGQYEVRYVVQQSSRTLASVPITLAAVSANLHVTGAIVPGGRFTVEWAGPANPQDYITIVPAGAAEGAYTDYARVSADGSPVELKAPDEAGDYEVRYVINQSGRTLSSLPVQVGGQAVSLAVQGEVKAGAVITVEWTGPGRYEDVIEVVPAGSADDAKGQNQARASQGSPLQLFAPAQAGEYELRYRATDSGEVLGRLPVTVK